MSSLNQLDFSLWMLNLQLSGPIDAASVFQLLATLRQSVCVSTNYKLAVLSIHVKWERKRWLNKLASYARNRYPTCTASVSVNKCLLTVLIIRCFVGPSREPIFDGRHNLDVRPSWASTKSRPSKGLQTLLFILLVKFSTTLSVTWSQVKLAISNRKEELRLGINKLCNLEKIPCIAHPHRHAFWIRRTHFDQSDMWERVTQALKWSNVAGSIRRSTI